MTHGSSRVSLAPSTAALALILLSSCQGFRAEFPAQDATQESVRLLFTGNEALDTVYLTRSLRRITDPYDENGEVDASLARAVIAEQYRRLGFADVEVETKLEIDPATARRSLAISIREGPRVVVESLEIEGNSSIPSSDLLRTWTQSQATIFGDTKRNFVASDMEELARAIQAEYMNAGYLQARITHPQVDRSEDETRAHIKIQVREGPIFSIRSFAVADRTGAALDALPTENFKGETFRAQAIDTYRRQLVRALRERGYPTPDLRVTIAKVADKNSVDVLIDGKIGEVARLGDLQIEGARRVREGRIRRAFSGEDGSIFRGSEEDRAVRELMSTGEFAQIEIDHEMREDGRVDRTVRVYEAFQAPFDPSTGYRSYERVTGLAKFSLDNIFESGLDLRAHGEIHAKGHLLSASLRRSEILADTSLSLGTALARQRQPSFQDRVFSAEARLRHSLAGPLEAQLGYRFEDHDDSWSDTADPAADRAIYERGLLFTELVSKVRDHPFRPRVGHTFRLQSEWSDESLGGDLDAVHLSVDFTKWLRVADSVHLMARVRSDAIWNDDASGALPIQERVFLGGEDSVRSFREDQASPKDRDGEALGGEFRNLLQLETRLAVHPLADLVIFGDAGNVGRRVRGYGLSNLRYAVGLGLHALFQDRMPIRLDAAWNPDRKAGEEEWVLHLRIGYVD